MPLNPAFKGRVYPPTEPYEVGREKIREFAEAIGEPDPAADPDGPVVAPPTFAIVLTMRAERQAVFDPELGLDLSRLLHREQRFDYTRPIVAGDRLTVTVRVEDVGGAGPADVLTLSSAVTTTGGEHVCTATATLVTMGDEDA
ncbi:MaoC family dehydratase N-terminal domain-containing protein [Microbispora corallina]|uniref:UPF0336 protein Mco01_00470 n=1 Tax=Microbispora corallina TaxID=83302 RepID=A0ABQ4FQG7_9ACTN|nr:MaoC family dehydratase N-terminal domain-containing protein [Microbispora corallina]GIH37047.1 UPF0336 protein [Microbispora corallina]